MRENTQDICERLRYPSDLRMPIAADDPKNVFTPVLTMAGFVSYHEWFEHEFDRKLLLLLDHYKIQRQMPEALATLVRRLALDWIPGFEFVSKLETRGRKRSDKEDIYVAEEIKRLLELNPTLKLGEACKKFQRDQKTSLKNKNTRTIESKYRRGLELIDDRDNWLERWYKRYPPQLPS